MKVADETKLAKDISDISAAQSLQIGLNNLMSRKISLDIEFNIGKFKVMHVGRDNLGHSCYKAA